MSPLYALALKLKRLKKDLKTWNLETFGNVMQNVARAEDDVLLAQAAYDDNPTASNLLALNKAKDELLQVQLQEEVFWRQKSHVKWLREGDNNTKFFHASVVQKRAATAIHELIDDQGEVTRDPTTISSMIQSYYQDLFTSQGCQLNEELMVVSDSLGLLHKSKTSS